MMQRLKLPQRLRWCVMQITLTLAFAHAAMALQLPRQHCYSCTHMQQSWHCPIPQKDKTEEAKIIEKQLDRLIRSKKGMLMFRSQADLAHAFDLMANYPKNPMTNLADSAQPQLPPVVAYLEKAHKGFKSLYGAPGGLPSRWRSYPLLAALLNQDQALIVRDDMYAFDGPEHLYRLPESQRKSYEVLRNQRFSNELPNGSAMFRLKDDQPQSKVEIPPSEAHDSLPNTIVTKYQPSTTQNQEQITKRDSVTINAPINVVKTKSDQADKQGNTKRDSVTTNAPINVAKTNSDQADKQGKKRRLLSLNKVLNSASVGIFALVIFLTGLLFGIGINA